MRKNNDITLTSTNHKDQKYFIDLSTPYTVDRINHDLHYISNSYPDLTTLITIGQSFEGRPLYAIKLGNDKDSSSPCVLLISNIHAREDYSSILVMKQIEYILVHYYTSGHWGSYNLKDILSKISLWFIPVANPDGLNIIHNGIKSSLNYRRLKQMPNPYNDDRWWKANANGVDLNRNFDDGFWDIRTSPMEKSSEMYKGDAPNSEPETKAIQNFCIDYQPDMAISYHSFGEVFFWADRFSHPQFKGLDTKVVEALAKLTGYKKMPIGSDPSTFSCGFENWYRTIHNKLSICVELSPVPTTFYKRNPHKIFYPLVFEKAKFVSLELAVQTLQSLDIL